MTVPDDWVIPVVTVVANAAVTWGVVSTKLQWLRSDVGRLEDDVKDLRRAVMDGHHGQKAASA